MFLEKWLLSKQQSSEAPVVGPYKMYTWGSDSSGTLGQNVINIARSNPTQVGLLSWTTMSVGEDAAYAIRSDNLLFVWGLGANGRLGLNDIINRSSPTQLGSSSWSMVAAGKSYAFGITTTGALFAWGDNALGKLGLNDAVNRSSPTQIGTSSYTFAAAGIGIGLAIDINQRMFKWGAGAEGAQANHLDLNKSSPVQLTTLFTDTAQAAWIAYSGQTPYSWSQLSIGSSHSMAIRNDGLLFGWGLNTFGQLGDGTTQNRLEPYQIGTSSWTLISAGISHTVGITTAGTLFGWGYNANSQAYFGDTIDRSNPTQISTNINYASAGEFFTMFIDANGLLYGLGQNNNGQLATDSIIDNTNLANAKSGGPGATLGSWTQVTAGKNHTLGVKSDGTLWAWGLGTSGQLIHGVPVSRSSPVQVSTIVTEQDQVEWINFSGQTASSWRFLASGANHIAAIRNDYRLFTWGTNTFGQLGDGTTLNKLSPILIGTSSWSMIACGDNHTVGITVDGTLFTWGSNFNGQLATGSTSPTWPDPRLTPVQILEPTTNNPTSFIHCSTDALSTFVVYKNASNQYKMYGSGYNTNYELGLGDTVERYNLTLIGGTGDQKWIKVGSNLNSGGALALKGTGNSGSLWFWGYSNDGANPYRGILGATVTTPIPVTTLQTYNDAVNFATATGKTLTSWTTISSGYDHAIALRSDGKLFAWGSGTQGQLGLNSTATVSDMQVIGEGAGVNASWTLLSSGLQMTIAKRADENQFRTWGLNSSGQLGTNDTLNRSSPTLIAAAAFAGGTLDVAGGEYSTAAINNLYQLYVWGQNTFGQLGLRDNINRSTPVQIAGSWTQVKSSVDGHLYNALIYGIKTDGSLWVMGGEHDIGRVGLPGIDTNFPQQITTLYSEEDQNTWLTNSGDTAFSWTQVSMGERFGAAIRNDGRLFVWGRNNEGQLGLNDTLNRYTPTAVDEVNSWVQIACGSSAMAAIKSNKLLYVWGNNDNGQLGINSTLNRSSPVQVGTSSWTQIAVGTDHMYAINTDNLLWAWGLNTTGELGLNSVISRSEPQQIGSSSWTQVYAGKVASGIAIDASSRLFTWGLNNAGQLGQNNVINFSSPVQVTSIFTEEQQNNWITTYGSTPKSWTQLSIGQNFTLGINTDGTLWAWGFNNAGQLGDNSTINRMSMVQIGTGSWTSISAGVSYALAIDTLGRLYAWGVNNGGRLGVGDTLNRSSPVQVGSSSWLMVSAGNAVSYGITIDNLLFSWGDLTSGALGNSSISRSAPLQIGSSSWTAVYAGNNYGSALRTDGALFVWGTNANGELGLRNTITFSSPVQISSLKTEQEQIDWTTFSGQTASSWSQIKVGGNFSMALKPDGSLWTWGAAGAGINVGQLGHNDSAIARLSPFQVGTSSWTQIAAGESHAAAIRTDGGLFIWGNNTFGELGLGVTTPRSSPVQVGSSSYSQVTAGTNGTMALTTTGNLFVWGSDTTGSLGQNTQAIHRSNPIQVTGTWAKVGTINKNNTTYAIKSDNTLYGWGNNIAGKLGIVNTVNRSSPVLISSISTETDQEEWLTYSGATAGSWTQLSIGTNHAAALRSDGSLWVWGINNIGQVGLTPTETPLSPRKISAAESWSLVVASNSFTAGIRSADGSLWTWGLNSSGQLATGDIVNRSSPVQIGTSSYTFVTAGSAQLYAITTSGNLFVSGNNVIGILGNNSTINRSAPTQVTSVNVGNSWKSISVNKLFGTSGSATATESYVAAIGIDGNDRLFIWGNYYNGNMPWKVAAVNDGINFPQTYLRSAPTQITSLTSETEQTSYLTFTGGTAKSWSQVDKGATHVVALKTDGSIYVWGQNTEGQLGTNELVPFTFPVKLNNSSYTQVDTGYNHTFALGSNKLLYGWGENVWGQLGNNSTINRSSPVQIGSSSWTQISAGDNHSVGITSDKLLYTWGLNNSGQLGQRDGIYRSNPSQVGNSSWSQVDAGRNWTLAIDNDGVLWAWGLNNIGQLGTNFVVNKSSPTQITSLYTEADQNAWITYSGTTAKSWTQISMSNQGHSLAIGSDGSLWAWGLNDNGQLGTNTLDMVEFPIKIGSSSWTQVFAGNKFSLAIKTDGTLWAWGLNSNGALGQNNTLNRSSPVQIGSGTYTSVSARDSADNALAINSAGQLFAWGLNSSGQLGLGDTLARSSPTQVAAYVGQSFSVASAGTTGGAAIDNEKTLWVWGNNTGYQQSQVGPTYRSAPVQITTIQSETDQQAWLTYTAGTTNSWSQIAVGYSHTLAIKTDGSLWAWGLGNVGQLGFPFLTVTSVPNKITSVSGSWALVAAGGDSSYAAKLDPPNATYLIYSWGLNANGQLGLGDTINRSAPTQVTGGAYSNIKNLSAGKSHAAVIDASDKLWVWGLNSSGQLGVNDTINRSAPVQVGTASYSKIFANEVTSAIRTDDTLYMWGTGALLQLGQANTLSRSSPVQVSSLKTQAEQTAFLTASGGTANSWSQISVGFSHTLGLKTDGSLWAWGTGSSGQLGTGEPQFTTTPLKIGTSSWSQVAAGTDFSAGITTTNLLYVWGINAAGQLGLNDTINRSSPVQVGTSSWTSVNAGYSHIAAITSTGALLVWGLNANGQLGQNDIIARSSPTQVGTATYTKAFANATKTAAITNTTNLLFMWGLGTSNELGQINALSRSSPVQVSSLRTEANQDAWLAYSLETAKSWTQIKVGTSHSLGIKSDGSLWAWGTGSSGQLGTGEPQFTTTPLKIGTSSWSQVAAGTDFSAGITTTNLLYVWGINNAGQLGLNDVLNRSSPVQVGTSSWISVAAGSTHTVAVKSDNTLFTWGLNSSGQLGNNLTTNRSSPVQLGTSLDPAAYQGQFFWNTAYANLTKSGALDTNGRLFMWGTNATADLGQINLLTRSSPVQVSSLRTEANQDEWTAYSGGSLSWTQIAVGKSHALGIKSDYQIYAWGAGAQGQLGVGVAVATANAPVIVPTSGYLNIALKVAVGDTSSYAVYNDQGNNNLNFISWGNNNVGQLGTGDTINRSSPVVILTAYTMNIAAGSSHAVAALNDGDAFISRMYIWGLNSSGQLGLGDTLNRSSPTQLLTYSSAEEVQPTAALTRTALSTPQGLYMWGTAANAETGQNNTLSRSSPVQVSSLRTETDQQSYLTAIGGTANSWSQIAVGTSHSLALRTDGSLWAWGVNASGQLGTSNRLFTTSPFKIGSSSWSQIAAGTDFSLAIEATGGGLFAWGINNAGQLGILDVIARSDPTQVGAETWTRIKAGSSHAIGIKTNGSLWAWGLNSSGQLGLNLTTNRSEPVQIGSSSWNQVFAGLTRSGALTTGNVLYMWGPNLVGEIGQRDAITKSSPVLVTSLLTEADQTAWITYSGSSAQSWSQLAVGRSHNLAIRTDGGLYVWGTNTNGQLGNDSTSFTNIPIKLGTKSWLQVSAEGDVSAAIDNTYKLFTWGNNNVGQLGLSDVINRSSPVQIGTSSWIQVSMGTSHVVALLSTNLLFTWGLNSSGQLGLIDTLNRSSPVQVGTSSWSFINGGFTNTAGISNNLLFMWGSNSNYTLGQMNTVARSSPVQVTSLSTEDDQTAWLTYTLGTANSWSQISVKNSHAMALKTDGSLWLWGLNSSGQLGTNTTNFTNIPTKLDNNSWISISTGFSHSVAVRNDYKLFTWGGNAWGNLGTGDTLARSSPVQIGTSSWTQVSAGVRHTLAIASDATLYAWGATQLNSGAPEYTMGYLGTGNSINRSSPVQVGTDSWTQISAFYTHTLGINSEGLLFAWGADYINNAAPYGVNPSGQTGARFVYDKSAPTQVTSIYTEAQENSWVTYTGAAAKSWMQVSKGPNHALAVRSDGRLFAWGVNNAGQLGTNDVLATWVPVKIGTSSWSQVAAGASFSLAITSDGKLFTWGLNSVGTLAQSDVANRSSPVQVGAATNWSSISAGTSHALAINTLGALFTWGGASSGQLGLTDTLNRSSPVQIGSSSWTSVSAGGLYTAAILTTGGLFLWGRNNEGNLGIGLTTNRSSPVQVGAGSWKAVASGNSHVLALTNLSLLFAWGLNAGALGDNTSVSRSSPVQVGSSSWVAIAAGNGLSLGITSANTLWSWGQGANGELGLSSTITRSAPTQIGTSSFSMVFASQQNSAPSALNAVTKKLYAWGAPIILGTGQNVVGGFSSPVFMRANDDTWSVAAAGDYHSAAIRADKLLFTWGRNTEGQLGDITVISKSSVTQIGTSSWSQVTAGALYTAAIINTKGLFTWGSNQNGQLGDAAAGSRSSPVQIGTSSWSILASGAAPTVMAIKNNGQLFIWGNGAAGTVKTTFATTNNSPLFIPANDDSWASVSVTDSHTVGIRSDRLLYAWGVNTNGQLGNNSTINRSSPTQIGTSSWSQVSASTNNTYGILAGGTGALYAWGLNSSGQLGLGDTIARSNPTQIGSSSWTLASADGTMAAAVNINGQLFAWGNGASGQIQGNYASIVNSPTLIPSQTDTWSSLAIGDSHTVGIRADKLLYGWGLNTTGQLGLNTVITRSGPVQIGSSSWVSVAAGNANTLGITNANTLWAWGNNASGQLGVGDSLNRSNPTQIGTSTWTAVATGINSGSAAIKSNNQLFAWGLASTGQVSGGLGTNESSPVFIRSVTESWTAVALGDNHTVGVRKDYLLYAWGLNSSGQLGNNSTINRSSPTQIGTSSWVTVAAGSAHTTGILSGNTGALYGWGLNSTGQLGLNDLIARSNPTQIGSSSWTTISAGGTLTGAIKTNGQLFAWGLGTTGLITGSFGQNESSPVFIRASDDTWISVGIGDSHTAAVRTDQRLFAWGGNGQGQVGDGTVVNRSSPVQIGTSSWSSVTAGSQHSLGILSNSALYAWGLGGSGQLGIAATTNRSSPTQIGTSNWVYIAARGTGSAAIKENSQLYAWGIGTTGQISSALGTNESSPVFIRANDDKWFTVASGDIHTVAIRGDKLLYAWGVNTQGQIGDGTVVNRSSPVQIGSSSWSAVSAGSSFSLGLLDGTGALYAWGLGTSGETGLSVSTNRSSPTQIGTSSWFFLSSMSNKAAGILTDRQLFAWGLGSTGQISSALGTNESSPVFIRANDDKWFTVATGSDHTLGIRSDKLLFAWGGNGFGQMGTGDVIPRSSPTQIGSSSWSAVAAGNSYSLGLLQTGALYAWGVGAAGQTGTGLTTRRSSPTQIGTSSWSVISAQNSTSAAVKTNGQLFAWGLGTSGQIDWGFASRSSPVFIAANQVGFSAVSVGNNFITSIREDNLLFALGNNDNGQLGITSTISRSFPVQVGTSSWTAIASSSSGSTLGKLAGSGLLYVWGLNTSGQLGINDVVSRSSPVQISATRSWSAFEIAGLNGAAIRTDNNQLYVWGTPGGSNVLGIRDSQTAYSSPVLVISVTDTWSSISTGMSTVAAIRADKKLFTWGLNNYGQLGHNDVINKSRPTQVGSSSWSLVSAGEATLGLINGVLYGWGAPWGSMHVDSIYRSNPVQVSTTTSFTMIGAIGKSGYPNGYTINTNGQLQMQGWTRFGEIGNNYLGDTYDNFSDFYLSSPVFIPSVDDGWFSASIGSRTGFAIRNDKKLFGWGENVWGQLGNNTTYNSTNAAYGLYWGAGYPVKLGTSSWTMVQAGQGTFNGNLTLAIDSIGQAYAWGANATNGGTDILTTDRSAPTQIDSQSWAFITTGVSNSTTANLNLVGAIQTNGRLNVWGSAVSWRGDGTNSAGTTTYSSSPVFIRSVDDTWNTIDAGLSHGVGIRTDGRLYAWGLNSNGQLGNNSTINRSSPTQIGTSSWVTVAAGSAHTTGILSGNTGALYGWGLNSTGQLGLNDLIARSNPTQIGSSSWTTISAAGSFTGAITTNNQLYNWGLATFGQIGDGSVGAANISNPTFVVTVPDSWSMAGLGISHTAAIRADKKLFTWGLNTSGQLGTNNTITRSSAGQVGSSSWSLVHAGRLHTVALNLNKLAFGWGNNNLGELGDGSSINKSSPIQIGTSSWITIDAGIDQRTTGGIRYDNNQIYMWGFAGNGQLGDGGFGGNIGLSSPNLLVTVNYSDTFTNTSMGISHGVAVRNDNMLFTWGLNNWGQLGHNDLITKSRATQVGSDSWYNIKAGESFTIGLKSDKTLWTWGNNDTGELGVGDIISRSNPTQVGSSSWAFLGTYFAASAAISHTAKQLYVWGNDGVNEGTIPINWYQVANYSNPLFIRSANDRFTHIEHSGQQGAAIRTDGKLYVWGQNTFGELGQNDIINRSLPVQILGDYADVYVPAMGDGTTNRPGTMWAKKTDGTWWNWGYNLYGNLANNSIIHRSSPVQVNAVEGTTSSFSLISGSRGAHFGLLNNSILVWARNNAQQYGVQYLSSVNRSNPVMIPGMKVFVDGTTHKYEGYDDTFTTVTRRDHSLALREDGTLWRWGRNNRGQLGDNTAVDNDIPRKFDGSWISVGGGRSLTVAIRSDGALFTTGRNNFGQLGILDLIDRSSPVQVGTRSYSFVGSNDDTSAVISANSQIFIWGETGQGQTGNNQNSNTSSPIFLRGLQEASWTMVAVGDVHSAAIRGDKRLYVWGQGTNGKLGLNDVISKSSPSQLGTSSWSAISAGTDQTFGITINGALFAWGKNNGAGFIGTLGINDTISRSSPVQIGSSSWTIVTASLGEGSQGAIKTNGQLYMWGDGNAGMGDGTLNENYSSPIFIRSVDEQWDYGSVGGNVNSAFGHAIRSDGLLYGWGWNAAGTIGDNSTMNRSRPVQIGNSWNLVSATQHVLAIDSNNKLHTWGFGANGRLGHSDVISRSSPTQLGTGNWSSVVAAGSFSMAINSSNYLFTWGLNTSGQLGNNSTISRSSPTQLGSDKWYLAAGKWSTFAGGFTK